jgi:hypothetical protein
VAGSAANELEDLDPPQPVMNTTKIKKAANDKTLTGF